MKLFLSTEAQKATEIEIDKILKYVNKKLSFLTNASLSIGVDKAFSNPKTFKVASETIGYGVANLFMGGNVSLIQMIIELF